MSAYSIATRGLAGRKIPQGVLAAINTLLFGSSEPGAWYDPSDLSTLFQDSAGTTPVTAVEQAVALMLDKSGRGNHASQATSAKRPKYSRRVNLFIDTDTPSTPAWATAAASMTGGNLVPSATLGVHTTSQSAIAPGAACVKFTAKQNGYTRIMLREASITGNFVLFDLVSGYIISNSVYTGSITPSISVAGGFDCTVNLTGKTSASEILAFTVGNSSTVSYATTYFTADGVSGVLISKLSLVSSIDAHLPHQSVNTATDYDADPSKFPAYLRFDGVDDAMQTGNIDFTGTDKMTVWAGVTRLTQEQSIVCELSNTVTNNGMFYSGISSGNYASFISRGTGGDYPNAYAPLAPPPVSAVIGGAGSIGDQISTARVNGVSINSNLNQGTGNYGNYPLYIGARAGTTLFFNGRIYSLIVRGAQSSLSQIEAVETLIRQKMRLL